MPQCQYESPLPLSVSESQLGQRDSLRRREQRPMPARRAAAYLVLSERRVRVYSWTVDSRGVKDGAVPEVPD